MNFFHINETSFQEKKILSKPLDITLIATSFQVIAKKFPTLNTLNKHSFVFIDPYITLVSTETDKIHIFNLKQEKKTLVVIAYNEELQVSLNGVTKSFVSNELNMKSVADNSEKDNKKSALKLNKQEKLAFEWLTINGIGSSAKSICFHTFPKLKTYYENETNRSFDFSHPNDGDDLSRCFNVIEQFSLTKKQIDELKNISPEWANLIENIDVLREKFEQKQGNELYKFMQECINKNSNPKPKL